MSYWYWDAVGVTALCLSTYLSLVKQLLYPRNWWPLKRRDTVITVALAAATAYFVAVTDGQIAWPRAVAATLLLAALFLVIRAPAYYFKPDGRGPLLALLANRGRYAGLGIATTVFLISMFLEDPRFSALSGTAMFIEACWFIQCHWPRRRTRYLLTADDTAVLRTVAGAMGRGDITQFADQYGIWELESGPCGQWYWHGCDKRTPPCPFNYYSLQLGLNAAPCCRQHLQTLCSQVTTRLEELGATYWLDGGTLLGAVREQGQLLAWEDDVDIGILLEHPFSWEALVAQLPGRCHSDGLHVEVLSDYSYLAISFDPPRPWPLRWQRNRMRGELRLDLIPYYKKQYCGQEILARATPKGAMQATDDGLYAVPADAVLPTRPQTFLDRQYPIPNEPEAYLTIIYGDFNEIQFTYMDQTAAHNRS